MKTGISQPFPVRRSGFLRQPVGKFKVDSATSLNCRPTGSQFHAIIIPYPSCPLPVLRMKASGSPRRVCLCQIWTGNSGPVDRPVPPRPLASAEVELDMPPVGGRERLRAHLLEHGLRRDHPARSRRPTARGTARGSRRTGPGSCAARAVRCGKARRGHCGRKMRTEYRSRRAPVYFCRGAADPDGRGAGHL